MKRAIIEVLPGATISLIVIFIVMILSLGLTGCSKPSDNDKPNVAVAEIERQVSKVINLSGMMKLDKEGLKRFYDINPDNLEEFSVYVAESNIRAEEFVLIKLKDTASANGIKGNINKRREEQLGSFKDYLPEEYKLIEDSVMISKGKYIFYAVSEGANEAGEIFKSLFKN